MSLKFFISAIFFFEFISIWYGCNGYGIMGTITPNVTGLIPYATISQTISLYATNINMILTVYQHLINNTLQDTLQVITGNTNVDSTNRCIAYGVSFSFWGQYPIINSQETGNGGCDAILGRECSQSIHNLLKQSFDDINSTSCGVRNQNILTDPPTGCRLPKTTASTLISSTFLKNGSFTTGESSTANSSNTWMYRKNYPSVDNGDDDLMKSFVFTYFVGRPYSSGIIDSAIACFSIYNTTVGSSTRAQLNGMATQLFVSEKFLIFLSLSHVFSRFMVYLPS
ncbi:unnamed protein product [Adineta steineri]|uniref:Uncharacterized protein n=1 Tax=Adineta steineri TaxID=433720 RepID=A0A815NAH0_9BILA|nr:unnamed protein product [Adineta steineri]CAF1624494.1 unnamed protein product [Adineta steineri]